jgi:glycolate oxidase
MDEEKRRELARCLEEITGQGSVETKGPVLLEYSSDMTENEPHPPDVVVAPENVGQVSRIMALAHERSVPVVPRVYNTNLGGLAIPEQGGILLDLRRMKKILEVNPRDLYMIIEPGVTQADVHRFLEENHPGLRIGYSLAPPDVSVLANCLMDGLVNLSFRYGAMGQWVNGLEVVLPGGEVIRTGSSAVVSSWHGEPPLPHLSALFFNTFGTTGVVTKASVQVWPKPEFEEKFFVLAGDTAGTEQLLTDLARSELPDDIGVLSWPLGKLLFGNRKPLFRDEAEPLFFLYIALSSRRQAILREKISFLKDLVSEKRRQGLPMEEPFNMRDLVAIEPGFSRFSQFPTRLDFLLDHPGGGLTWLGTYGPMSQWARGVEEGMGILRANGMPPIVVTRPMWGGHFIVLRFIMMFDKSDRQEVEKVKRLQRELLGKVLERGFIPYKTPPWAYRMMVERMDPGFTRLMEKVRHLLDPRDIMNPGKWPV